MRYATFPTGRRFRQASILAILLAGIFPMPPAKAQEILPALFDVVDVASDDVLNVREEPDPASPVIGTIPPDGRGIEIVRLDEGGGWGRVNTGERAGWVSMRFLEIRSEAPDRGAPPEALRCSGTEPFWAFDWSDGAISFSTPDMPDGVSLDVGKVLSSMTLPMPHWIVLAADGERRMTAFIQPQMCSDGMSDLEFGLAVTLADEGGADGARAYSGCCSLQVR